MLGAAPTIPQPASTHMGNPNMTGPGSSQDRVGVVGAPELRGASLPSPPGAGTAQFRSQEFPGQSLSGPPTPRPTTRPLLLAQKPKVSWEA